MNSTQNQNDADKPIVVLAGWLGCRPRNLRRFSQMYDRMGWGSLTRIGSPESAVAAMTEGPHTTTTTTTHCQPLHSELKHLAIDTLQELQTIQPSCWILHVFSNNGCFLWEWIRYLLFFEQEDSSLSSSNSDIDIHNLGQTLIGIVFDSAPAHYGGKVDTLQLALQYVSTATERNRLLHVTQTLDTNEVTRRFNDFWGGLCNDSIRIPQIYLYSRLDKLAAADKLEMLIAHREKVLGKNKVRKRMFPHSEHCCHLMKYPKEYDRAVRHFLRLCEIQTSEIRGNADVSKRSKL